MEKSGEHAIPIQYSCGAVEKVDQLTPPSTEKYIVAARGTVAASLVKSGVEATPCHSRLPAPVMAVHVTPLSLDLKILPPFRVAAIFLKSGEAVTPNHSPPLGVVIDAVLDG
jgi:hypothetical protein